MEPVYGRKSANGKSAAETWMDRFTRLEPAGGLRAAVEQAWKAGSSQPQQAAWLNTLNGSRKGTAHAGSVRSRAIAKPALASAKK